MVWSHVFILKGGWENIELGGDEDVINPLEWKVYEALYVKNLTEEETAKLVGYKTSEKDRKPGYKQIKNIQKSIICKVKKILQDNEIDIL